MNTQNNDQKHMLRALEIAKNGLFSTDPNPRVGCVFVKNSLIIGEGWHERAGEQHAEIMALSNCKQNHSTDIRGATCYVTLEPCSHHGQTSPCADALIEAKVSRIVIAMKDPNPLVSGTGIERIKAAGIEVDIGILKEQAEALNPGFIKRMKTGYPMVTCKLGMSIDAKTAMASGESQWITCDQSRADVQLLRARSSAIITGSSTVKVDNPSMNVRSDQFPDDYSSATDLKQPWRVIMDTHLSVDPSSKIFSLPGRVIWITSQSVNNMGSSEDCTMLQIPEDSTGKIDPIKVLKWLADQGCNEVMIEAGAKLSGAFINADLVDHLVVYMAPKILGDNARGLLHLPGLDKLSEAKQFSLVDIKKTGVDVCLSFAKE